MKKAPGQIFFTVPEAGLRSGGYSVEIEIARLVGMICSVETLTFARRCDGYRHLDDVVRDHRYEDAIFVVHWGPEVPGLLRKLKGKNVVHHAHSTGWGFDLPVDVPVVAGQQEFAGLLGALRGVRAVVLCAQRDPGQLLQHPPGSGY